MLSRLWRIFAWLLTSEGSSIYIGLRAENIDGQSLRSFKTSYDEISAVSYFCQKFRTWAKIGDYLSYLNPSIQLYIGGNPLYLVLNWNY